ncbi:MAG TPA: TlyA family RNA methyltransferase, partial [Acidobacteriota bacterium]|nr:TlyA family RNA methyltransferase [Acidobacteriota bacterium]
MSKKIRIDQLLVRRGLVESREAGQRLILAHKVMIGERYAEKPGQQVAPDADVRLLEELKYVSRGGYKLERALDEFGVDVAGKVVLDVGVSTGGFSDCLLQRGARSVYAVDVGYGQIAWKLREDPRVVLLERTNARSLVPEQFPEPIDLAVMDVSFISAKKILEPLARITAEVLFLLKPQFEAGREEVPRGGVIRDPAAHARVLNRFFSDLPQWNVLGLTDSPIEGGSGNREFLVRLSLREAGWPLEKIQTR